jgi:23S rRNA pseudouridine1911/1915/1917 synthase
MPLFDKRHLFENLKAMPELGDMSQWRNLGRPIGHNFSSRPVVDHLAERFQFLSRELWIERIALGHVTVSGRLLQDPSYSLGVGDRLAMYFPEEWEPPGSFQITKLYESGDTGVFLKPSGIPMHENGPYYRKTFSTLLAKQHGPEWSAMHRLDKETSGVVLCGRSKEVRKKLSDLFFAQQVQKSYRCLVSSAPTQKSWESAQPIGKPVNSQIRIKNWVDPEGDPALTRFQLLGKVSLASGYGDLFELEARPLTGRTHQIRVHLASSGLTILGDKLYQPEESVFLQYLEEGDSPEVIQKAGFPRLALHAQSISWECIETQERVEVSSAIDWNSCTEF